MLNLLNLNVNHPEVNNHFLPWDPAWYPATMTRTDWEYLFDWFVEKNINDRHSNLLDKEGMRKKAIQMAALELTNGNNLYSKNLDTRSY